MEMEPLVPHHAAAPWSLPAAQTLAEREELLLVQHSMEGCSNGEASAAGRPPPLPCIHLLPPHMIRSSRHPPLMMMNTRASTATTTPRTWSNSATTSSTTWRRPWSCVASTTTSSPVAARDVLLAQAWLWS